jgi:ApaG protein
MSKKYQFTCRVEPQALPDESDPQASVFAFAYTITIQNTGQVAAQLISRHWLITDANGHTEEVKGLGVVGHQPLLQPGEAFE